MYPIAVLSFAINVLFTRVTLC